MASGTVGSALTLAVLWLLPWSVPALLLALVAVIALGLWSGSRVERRLGRKDPGVVVIDEVAGMMLAVLLLPRSPAVYLAAFVLFRILDIVKPPPAAQSQALPGGWGIMADDLVAGGYTLALLLASRAVLGLPS